MVDPKAKKYKRWSSYNYVLNNPIINVDPKGDTVRVTITSNEIGKDYIRIVASESFGLDYNQETNLYQMTIADDVSSTVSEYSVTRDSPKAAQDPEGTFAGNDKNAYRVDNLAFEPKNSVGEYQGVMRTDGKAGGRLELRDRNDKNNDKVDGRRNIQVHVGGTYTNSEGRRGVVGSLGCCTLSGADKGNKGRDRFVSDITERVKNNSEANKSNIILIRYIKRDEKPDFNK